MKRKQFWMGFAASLGMLILIFDGKTALEGTQDGLNLCMKTVIPSLFPFFLLSRLITESFSSISFSILKPLMHICKIPNGAEGILISGFLGGYPVGAQCIANAYHSDQLSREDAERMLGFCNNAGPAFLFGIISQQFPNHSYVWALWIIHMLSAFSAGIFFRSACSEYVQAQEPASISLTDALHSSIRIMSTVCGWVIWFRILISFLQKWILWLFPVEVTVFFTGLLELSNGCCELQRIADIPVRFVICSTLLAFGGLCVTMQTISVTKGLSMIQYFKGKLLQTLFSFLLSLSFVHPKIIPVPAILVFSLCILHKIQKKSSIRVLSGV